MRIDVPAEQAHDPIGYVSATYAREIMASGGEFGKSVYAHSSLSLREFEGARARIAEINGCIVCQSFRAERDAPAMFAAAGARPDRLVSDNGPAPEEDYYEAVSQWRSSPVFSARERIAIEFAERFAQEPKVLAQDEAFWMNAHSHFTDGEIVDLAYCVAAWMGLGRVAHVLGFDTVCLPFSPGAKVEAA